MSWTRLHVPYFYTRTFAKTRTVTHRLSLSPGRYLVIPCTHRQDLEAEFLLRVFCEKLAVIEWVFETRSDSCLVVCFGSESCVTLRCCLFSSIFWFSALLFSRFCFQLKNVSFYFRENDEEALILDTVEVSCTSYVYFWIRVHCILFIHTRKYDMI